MSDSPPQPPPPESREAMALVAAMVGATPYAAALGFQVVRVGDNRVTLSTPWREELIGDADSGVIAGGVITALLDHVCGAAIMASLPSPESIATLDLRIDYLRAAVPGSAIFAEAHCYKLTRSVAFVRAVAYETSPDDPVANASGAFMRASNGERGIGANLRRRG